MTCYEMKYELYFISWYTLEVESWQEQGTLLHKILEQKYFCPILNEKKLKARLKLHYIFRIYVCVYYMCVHIYIYYITIYTYIFI